MMMPVIFIVSMYGQKLSLVISLDTIAVSFCVTVVPALMGYYLAKWEPEDELKEESWRKKK
jgi:hypothetical protein